MIQSGASDFWEQCGMVDSFINLENVCEAAAVLLTVDTYSIKPEILEDAEDFIVELKTALDNFNKPLNDKRFVGYSHIQIFEEHLSELLNTTKNLYNILTDESKDSLKRFIAYKKQMKNNAFPLSDN